MKDNLLLFHHSTVDIITNSSSELFAALTDLTAEEIREKFEALGLNNMDFKLLQGWEGLLQLIQEEYGSAWRYYGLSTILRDVLPLEVVSSLRLPPHRGTQGLREEHDRLYPYTGPKFQPGKPGPEWEAHCKKCSAWCNEQREKNIQTQMDALHKARQLLESHLTKPILVFQLQDDEMPWEVLEKAGETFSCSGRRLS